MVHLSPTAPHFEIYRHYRILEVRDGFSVCGRVFPSLSACRTFVDHLPTDED